MSGRLSLTSVSQALIVVTALSVSSFAGTYFDSVRVSQVLQAQTLVFNDRLQAADSIYRKMIETHPDDPANYLFHAGALFAEMSDAEENLNEPLLKQLLDTVDILSDRILDTCDNNTAAWMYLWRGHARSYRALWESKFGSSLRALKLGLSTIDEYEAGLKRDSTVIDLYAGIGSYHYWKSAKAGVLSWFGIFRSEKDKGIAELRRAADSSLLHCDLARSALIWVWLDRKEYDSAITLASNFLDRYPEGKTSLWPIAQARFRQANYAQAAETFLRIRTRLESSPGNYHNLIECDYYLAQCYRWLSDDHSRNLTATRFQNYRAAIPPLTLKRQSAKISYLSRLKAR
ncbi:MAG: hypothetical protein NTW07_10910 [candidate division Zixibacteria bacterium]|nr:hypothetical protein [candidate division Zixibacteria bacterium]